MKWSESIAPIGLMAVTAIATTAVVNPVMAETSSPQLIAQASLCRAANRRTPIFASDSTVSEAVQLVNANAQVTLTSLPAAGSQFAQISAPAAGYIQTAVLKACGTTPPTQTACRLVRNPSFINVRSEPAIPATNPSSNIIGGVSAGTRVNVILTPTGSVSSRQANGYNWVEIDATRAPLNRTGTGWLYNSVIGSTQSNLSLCP